MLGMGSPGFLSSSSRQGPLGHEKPVLHECLTLSDPRLQWSPRPLEWCVQCLPSSLGEMSAEKLPDVPGPPCTHTWGRKAPKSSHLNFWSAENSAWRALLCTELNHLLQVLVLPACCEALEMLQWGTISYKPQWHPVQFRWPFLMVLQPLQYKAIK